MSGFRHEGRLVAALPEAADQNCSGERCSRVARGPEPEHEALRTRYEAGVPQPRLRLPKVFSGSRFPPGNALRAWIYDGTPDDKWQRSS